MNRRVASEPETVDRLIGGGALRDPAAGGPAPTSAGGNVFFSTIIEHIPDMVFVKDARDLRFLLFNRAAEELLGYSRNDLLGKSDYDLWPPAQAELFARSDRKALRGKRIVVISEERITTRNGDRWLHTKKIPILDETGNPLYLLGISQDITARKLAEEHAWTIERELASVVEHAREAVVTWGADGRIISWNPAASTLYGIARGEAVGARIESLVPESAHEQFRSAQRKLLRGDQVPVTESYRLRAGSEVLVEESLFLLPRTARYPARIASIARDVSELARLRRATEILSGADRFREETRDEAFAPAMQEAMHVAESAAQSPNATVLLLGETGVGKGWLAHWIHANSPRSAKPFLEINCAALGRELLESELFGHERGAFTGALTLKQGLAEVADGGTLFLDEIGDMPPEVQAKLLTFLDTRRFRRVGGTRNLEANVRIIAATNADLKAVGDSGAFRKDLYFRLSVLPIVVPPLRERRSEIPALTVHFMKTLAVGPNAGQTALAPGVLAALGHYDWPGNIRELRNVIEHALILSRGATVELEHLPAKLLQGASAATQAATQLQDVEDAHIMRVLKQVGGNRTRAAKILGISRSTLKRKLHGNVSRPVYGSTRG